MYYSIVYRKNPNKQYIKATIRCTDRGLASREGHTRPCSRRERAEDLREGRFHEQVVIVKDDVASSASCAQPRVALRRWRCSVLLTSVPLLLNGHRSTLMSMPTMAKNAAAANQYRLGTCRGASSSPPTSPGFHPHSGGANSARGLVGPTERNVRYAAITARRFPDQSSALTIPRHLSRFQGFSRVDSGRKGPVPANVGNSFLTLNSTPARDERFLPDIAATVL
jgi:hypothetical protein